MARISKEDQARIRNDILEVASVKFQEAGFEHVSTKAIAKEVGIAEGTLFNYFDSKTHLFLEVFSEQFILENGTLTFDVNLDEHLVDAIMKHLEKLMKMMLRLPKPILTELMMASVRMAKKHPKQFKRFAELDFKYIEEMEQFLTRLQTHHVIKEVNPRLLSEMIYGVVMYEFLIYLYEKEVTKDDMKHNIRTKLDLLLQGYCQGGEHGN
ncbi:TetR/AcrR family transcriptional regulator [Candidatus Xianfuyuplasma coldseepsis]|uniref:TetR/AcrR family transcriptional regulator n=1 Tax=Candidatus Xianfuyuplasma coldseepsis TaxID=2782163 RepID=A0A7L7KUX0_9MOLU|nr:TetR/AcrR family transcriptional regulator [Xianfuyuplasma coldseepsis]QMS85568.1 TetR/AcrR family transcriptional regulator [Xianfuyuplasma coldseepsis]